MPSEHANDMPIRVAMVLPGLGRTRRGAEMAFVEVARRQTAMPDFHVTLFGMGSEGLEGLVHVVVPAPGRERFRRWPRLPAFRNFMAWEEFFFALALRGTGRFRPSRFDIVLGCSYPWISWIVRGTTFGRRPKFVFVTQNGDWPVRAGNREYRYFGCEGLVCVSPEHEANCLGRYPTAVIGNGVDTDRFRPPLKGEERMLPDAIERHLPKPGDARKVVLVCAALTPEKRVDAAIRAVALCPNAFLMVVGDGPLMEDATRLASELLPGRHVFTGSQPAEAMPRIFARADAFLHMNVHEPFGIVYLEAAATGLPIVAPDVPTARWILADTALHFADPDKSADVAGRIAEALRPETARQLGRMARERAVQEWSWDRQSRKYAEFFRRLCGRSPENRP